MPTVETISPTYLENLLIILTLAATFVLQRQNEFSYSCMHERLETTATIKLSSSFYYLFYLICGISRLVLPVYALGIQEGI